LATAGTGDVLAGILGALIAANADAIKSGEVTLAEVALGAIEIHRLAALKLSAVGPIAALDLANAVQSVVGEILESK
jgi:NAD(P)H-hydrate repair Nnr-like enzyme with NAD(P)H-hydrate dehydratase domain